MVYIERVLIVYVSPAIQIISNKTALNREEIYHFL